MRHRPNLGQRLRRACQAFGSLDQKDVEFTRGPEQKRTMEDLKQAIVMAPCLRLIDYHCDRWLSADGKHYPSRFGSIMWNDRESCYSQAKIEIYGLWRALQAYRLYIIGVKTCMWRSTLATSRAC